MRRDLMDILACPVCKGDLELRVDETEGDEIVMGGLLCKTCDNDFTIAAGIPDLRPPG
jgi:uncharacterized protein YbaR (Trm112 family)